MDKNSDEGCLTFVGAGVRFGLEGVKSALNIASVLPHMRRPRLSCRCCVALRLLSQLQCVGAYKVG